jgi:acylphosphatase
MTKSVRVVISGRVQGVWFRAWTTEQAEKRGLAGWVRNRLDGSVEALFSGPAAAVDAMIEACRQGPPAARVDHIAQYPADPPAEPGFRQARTA